MSVIGWTGTLIGVAAPDNSPAGNESKDTLDAFDADLFDVDGVTHALQALDITLRVQPLVRRPPERKDEAVPLIHSHGVDRDAQHTGGSSYRVEWSFFC